MSILGIDIGSTGVKAIAFNEEGQILVSSYSEYNFIFPKPNWIELDVENMWKQIFNTIRMINSSEEIKKDSVESLSVSAIGSSLTPLDKFGNVLYNTIYPTDTRSIKEHEYILREIPPKALYNICGYPPGFLSPLSKILWVKKNFPHIYLKTKKILFTEDLLYHKLGIRNTKISYSSCSRTLFFDIRSKNWSERILNEFDIDKNLFSEPSISGIEIGYIEKDTRNNLGFKKKVSVVTGGFDEYCNALGVGAIKSETAANNIGSTECITTVTDRIIINNNMFKNNFSTQDHVIRGKYITLAYNITAGSIIKWFKDEIISEEKTEINKTKLSSYDFLFSGLTFKPSGLVFLPYFAGSGTPYLDPKSKGALIGLNLSTGKKDIFKSIIEGLVFEITVNLELLKKSGVNILEIRAMGGGTKSDYWLNLKSSIINMPIKRMKITEAGCLAAMILAGYGTNKFNINEAVKNFVEIDKEFYPDKNIHSKYIESLERYRKLYKLIKQIF